jgi:thiol-disulfide isomerase/thioredoxin
MEIKSSLRRSNKKKKTKKKSKIAVYYFYMIGCPYCKEFNKIWLKLKKKNKNKFVKYNKDSKPELVVKYGIETYPAIVRVVGNKHKLYPTDDRTMDKLLKFVGR